MSIIISQGQLWQNDMTWNECYQLDLFSIEVTQFLKEEGNGGNDKREVIAIDYIVWLEREIGIQVRNGSKSFTLMGIHISFECIRSPHIIKKKGVPSWLDWFCVARYVPKQTHMANIIYRHHLTSLQLTFLTKFYCHVTCAYV